MGGYSTIYMTGLGFVTGKAIGAYAHASPISAPMLSRAGLRGLAVNAFYLVGPALLGYQMGVASFGNR